MLQKAVIAINMSKIPERVLQQPKLYREGTTIIIDSGMYNKALIFPKMVRTNASIKAIIQGKREQTSKHLSRRLEIV